MKSRGFTLIELAVVLAVIAVLAAVLTPLVTSYIDQAREARAASDVRTIAGAIVLYQRDTGRFPIYNNMTDANADTAAALVLFGTGTLPSAGAGWDFTVQTTAGLDGFLNTNKLSLPTSARGGLVAYRGPYLSSIGADPWGNAYLVTAEALKRASTSHAYVISAGPNGTLETIRTQANSTSFAVVGDDIVTRIR